MATLLPDVDPSEVLIRDFTGTGVVMFSVAEPLEL